MGGLATVAEHRTAAGLGSSARTAPPPPILARSAPSTGPVAAGPAMAIIAGSRRSAPHSGSTVCTSATISARTSAKCPSSTIIGASVRAGDAGGLDFESVFGFAGDPHAPDALFPNNVFATGTLFLHDTKQSGNISCRRSINFTTTPRRACAKPSPCSSPASLRWLAAS